MSRPTPLGAFASGGSWLYWLHTLAADGIIHVESPVDKTFPLGDFFDIFDVPLHSDAIGTSRGRVTVLLAGKVYLGDPRTIPLLPHAEIQLMIRKPLTAADLIRFPAHL